MEGITMAGYLKTPVVARELGVGYWRLLGLLRSGKINPPVKDSSGDYLWSARDLEAARAALGIDHRRRGGAGAAAPGPH
jgi:hypothetical protein